jgi:hypothetical protein
VDFDKLEKIMLESLDKDKNPMAFSLLPMRIQQQLSEGLPSASVLRIFIRHFASAIAMQFLYMETHEVKITQEVIDEAWKRFDGTCPFSSIAVECGIGCMTVEKCNGCYRSQEYRGKSK